MSATSSENVSEFFFLPEKSINADEDCSLYEKPYSRVKALNDPSTLKGNPEAILNLIDELKPPEFSRDQRINQYDNLVKLFKRDHPVCILLFGVEEDCGYALLYLAMKFLQYSSNFMIYGAYNLSQISRSNANMINAIVTLSGIEQIKTYFSPEPSANFLAQIARKHRFEWIIINHQDRFSDVGNVKMLESLSLVQPGISLLKINDFSQETDFEDYLMSAPMTKQYYAVKFKNFKYSGRWNLLYKEDDSSTNQMLFHCIDLLD